MRWDNHSPYTVSMAKYTLLLKQLADTEKETNGEFKIFSFDYDFYTDDEELKALFEESFIETYYFEEINAETVARWKHNLKARLNIIAPYYKKLYETELRTKNIDFMLNKDLREEIINEGTTNNVSNTVNKVSGLNDTINTTKNISDNSHSDTPITKINDIDKYMSDYSRDNFNGENKTNIKNTSDSTNKAEGTTKNSNKQILVSKGNIGITSSAELLKGWRDILIDINKLMIEDMHDMFLNIY